MRLASTSPGDPRRRRLLELIDALNDDAREQLLAFGEFLLQRHGRTQPDAVAEPQAIPRPEQESVVAAIRRLSATYSMLDKKALLNETSSLMSAHVLQGRPAAEVIDELEILFEASYRRLSGKTED